MSDGGMTSLIDIRGQVAVVTSCDSANVRQACQCAERAAAEVQAVELDPAGVVLQCQCRHQGA